MGRKGEGREGEKREDGLKPSQKKISGAATGHMFCHFTATTKSDTDLFCSTHVHDDGCH